MIQAVLDNLKGDKEDESLYNASRRFLLHDFNELQNYGKTAYKPEIIIKIIKSETKRLRHLYFIHNFLRLTDKLLRTDTENIIRYSEMYTEAIRYYRYTSLRDKGIIRQKREIRKFKRYLRSSFTNFRNISCKNINIRNSGEAKVNESFLDPERLAEMCSDMAGISIDEITLIKSETDDFISKCPENYLKKGLFAKYIGLMFGVVKYGYDTDKGNFRQNIILGSCYGITYLFDEIIDDPAYTSEHKEDYYRNISKILISSRGDEITYSGDPLIAFTENALIKMRDELPEDRWMMAAKAYSVIADASFKGSEWIYGEILSDEELYVNSALKGAYTRIIPAILSGYTISDQFLAHTLRSGYIFQLPDDLRDIPDDISNGNITAFNYYRYGANPLNHHPLKILILAISRASFMDFPEIKDAGSLYMSCIFQSLKALQAKDAAKNLCDIFLEMNFPDNEISRRLSPAGQYYDIINDFETEIAGKCTHISLDMKKNQMD